MEDLPSEDEVIDYLTNVGYSSVSSDSLPLIGSDITLDGLVWVVEDRIVGNWGGVGRPSFVLLPSCFEFRRSGYFFDFKLVPGGTLCEYLLQGGDVSLMRSFQPKSSTRTYKIGLQYLFSAPSNFEGF